LALSVAGVRPLTPAPGFSFEWGRATSDPGGVVIIHLRLFSTNIWPSVVRLEGHIANSGSVD